MRTAQQIEGDYADTLGRCESCGCYVDEIELIEFEDVLYCESCAHAYGIQSQVN